ncbi:MAG: hypothetical protein WCJ69_18095 [Betaproteobacteria bacterium]
MPSQRLARWIALLAEVVSGRAPVQERDSAYLLQIYAIAWISLLISAVCYVPVYALWLKNLSAPWQSPSRPPPGWPPCPII